MGLRKLQIDQQFRFLSQFVNSVRNAIFPLTHLRMCANVVV